MNRIYELQKKIETARHELDEALLQENRFEYYYEKSTRLDKLIEEYLESQEHICEACMRGPFFMPKRKFWAFFYCNLVQGGVILSYKWRKVVENGTKWWISS